MDVVHFYGTKISVKFLPWRLKETQNNATFLERLGTEKSNRHRLAAHWIL